MGESLPVLYNIKVKAHMRFLGNKTAILDKIENLLIEKGLFQEGLTFFDAFCGTGSVADNFKGRYNIVINDNLNWAVVYSWGRICSQTCKFTALGFDPFSFLNDSAKTREGFIYKNYSPTASSRMYFTAENAGRIDYFRWQIEEWYKQKKINADEHNYLLSCLIESVSAVSNTAGVYGAFLKKWDSRALKNIVFEKVDAKPIPYKSLKIFNDKIENIISTVDCDILYLDPPYTQNQYGTQYHLLETLVLDDNPAISKVTGSRSTAPMRSDWSKDIKSHILFDKVVAETKAKYILFSYNNDGFMSKEYIEATLKRYGKEETYTCKKIPYKKYQNWKSCNESEHFEYLFFVEKKDVQDVIYESPLNYIGSKAKVVSAIKQTISRTESTFYDMFGGGFNVGVNMPHNNIKYVDINFFVTDLIESFRKNDTYEYISFVRKQIAIFGLEKANTVAYQQARDKYNSVPLKERDPRLLFTIILYGYQQQIRFNGSYEFNNPVGMRWFNDKVLEKMISFSRHIKELNCEFSSASFTDYEGKLTPNDFVYMDPPYLLTTGSYNDGKRGFKGWDSILETELLDFAKRLSNRGIHFMLSYVVEHKGTTNKALLDWVRRNGYTIIELGDIIGISGSRRKEVLIINYERI